MAVNLRADLQEFATSCVFFDERIPSIIGVRRDPKGILEVIVGCNVLDSVDHVPSVKEIAVSSDGIL